MVSLGSMMRSFRRIFSTIALFSLVVPVGYAAELPLFGLRDVLDITFEVPMDTIVRDADDRPEVNGVMRYTGDDGQMVTLPLTMTTRGKSRLKYCRFPPLTVIVKRKQVKGTLFEGQKKLKLVTQCRNGSTFERYLHQEFGIYRAFNVLSEHSFRVRMLRATYLDAEGKRKDEVQPGFFIESDNEVAARLGMEKLKVSRINSAQLDPAHASKFSLFQYLIANTDWSMIKGPGNESCCHNGKVIIRPGAQDGWMVLPYDFDQAGLINTRYSMPADGLGIRTVRQRLFRGRCRNIIQLPDTIATFNEQRAAIEAELLPVALEGSSRRGAVGYIDDFYKIINDAQQRRKKIEDKCIGS